MVGKKGSQHLCNLTLLKNTRLLHTEVPGKTYTLKMLEIGKCDDTSLENQLKLSKDFQTSVWRFYNHNKTATIGRKQVANCN